MRLSIRTKVIMAVSIALVVIFALILFLLARQNITQLRVNLNQSSKSFASLATPPIGSTFALYQNSGHIKITQQVDKFLALDPDVQSIRIVSVDGDVQYGSQDGAKSVSSELASSFVPRYITDKSGYIVQVVEPYFEDSGAHRYSVVYDVSTKRAQKSVDDVIRLILLVGAAILLVSIFSTAWVLNALFIRPIREVSRSANLISSGHYDHEILAKNHDEIGDLAASVNRMAESLKADIVKLQDLDKLKSEFMMIASHNLRTPLTIMRGYIDMAKEAQTVGELRAIITSVQDGVVRLHLLAEDLLTISTLEAGQTTLKKVPVNVSAFVNATVDEFKLLADKKKLGWRFENRLPDSLMLNINESNMRSALGNIIDNAIKFTKEGGEVAIKSFVEGGQLVFTVRDTGIGIKPEEMHRLFTKFHRGTDTMTYDYEGAGIGLYLTKLIVEKHGGRVVVHSTPGKGSVFTVSLPLAHSRDQEIADDSSGSSSQPPGPSAGPPSA